MAITQITSFSRSGVSDWLLQRVSAVILAAYTLFMVGYFWTHPDLDYQQWTALHSGFCMKVFNIFTVLSIVVHAWIGMWTVLTDYVTVRLMGSKATILRIILQLGMIAVVLVYVLWAVKIFWGA